jgi:hypothetical protein
MDLNKELNNLVNSELDRLSAERGTVLNDMAASHAGQSVESIKVELAHLTTYADQISTGGGFDIDVHHLR